jgi:hypothetical protein
MTEMKREDSVPSAPLYRPLHWGLWGDRTEAEGINSASALGDRVGDDHALGDI